MAIIGAACKLPGADNPDAFRQLLFEGRCAVREVPPERWSADQYYSADPAEKGKSRSKWGGFLDDVAGFDAAFFQIPPHQARLMDPQQRLFMEQAFLAMEDAGYAPARLAQAPCGVFAGIMNGDYEVMLDNLEEPAGAHYQTGIARSATAGQTAYRFNLKGPCLTLDTACSSSLAAVHLACAALRKGEAETALAGGVTLYLTQKSYLLMSSAGMLSPQGQCRTFDAGADGFVPGEGCAVVLLKPLAAAVADHDRILGVIRGSGMNGDGLTNGMTAPSSRSQTELLAKTYTDAQINPDEIDYVEAHGTGTQLGDPIEIEGLTRAFRRFTQRRQYCGIGSVKTNLGHTSAAAGVAGLLKILLAMSQEAMPPSLHYHKPNPMLDLASSPFYVVTQTTPWPAPADRPRRAALSAFGFTGTNCHAVIEQWSDPRLTKPAAGPLFFPISAGSRDRFERKLTDLADRLEAQGDDIALLNVAHTLAHRDEEARYRCCIKASRVDELVAALRERRKSPAVASDDPPAEETATAVRLIEACRHAQPDEAEARQLIRAYEQGVAVDWTVLAVDGYKIPLPATRLQNRPYWLTQDKPAGPSLATGSQQEPIAVIGYAGRFARAADRDQLLDILTFGLDAVGPVPSERGLGPLPSSALAGMLGDVSGFEAAFWGISKEEAAQMDPQQRGIMEETYHALEDAGLAPDKLDPDRTGIYVGGVYDAYNEYLSQFSDHFGVNRILGNYRAMLAARVSYHLNLRGPAVMLDTACSSSLSAIHLACQSLWLGETDIALAGGVTMIFSARQFQHLTPFGVMSPSGSCRPFDAAADGIVNGEGAAMVVLKPYRAALRDGDHIHGLIRGIGINHDGRSNGVTAPSGMSQVRLMETVFKRSGVKPEDIDYIEAHGTGTKLGDAIELDALRRVYQSDPRPPGSCGVGSVKSTVGHAHAAAGICGLFKILLGMRAGKLFATPNFHQPNPLIAEGSGPLYVVDGRREWPKAANRPRRATLSSFGLSGTNAFAIIEEAPQPKRSAASDQGPVLIPLSARTPWSLEQLRQRLADHLESLPEPPALQDLAGTLAVGRTHHDACRDAVVVEDPAALITALRQPRQAAKPKPAMDLGRCLSAVAAPITRPAALNALADHYRAGANPAWSQLYPDYQTLPLPPYPFQRERCWVEPPADHSQAETPTATLGAVPATGSMATLIQLAARQFGLNEEAVDPDGDLSDMAPDSLSFLGLISEVEKRFGQSLQLGAGLTTLKQIQNFLVDGTRAQVPAVTVSQPQRVLAAYGDTLGDQDVSSRFIHLDDVCIELLISGDPKNPPLVLLPPWQAMANAWKYQFHTLSKTYRVIGFHYPGVGLSHWGSYPLDELGNLLMQCLDKLGETRPIHVIGWSLGGLVAQRLAHNHGPRLKSLCLVNTTANLGFTGDTAAAVQLVKVLQDDFYANLPGHLAGNPDDGDRLFRGIEASKDMQVLTHYGNLVFSFDNRAHLKAVAVPTLVLSGGRDQVTPPDMGRLLEDGIPGAMGSVHDSGGHYIPLLQPRWFNEKWRAFISQLDQEQGAWSTRNTANVMKQAMQTKRIVGGVSI